MEKLPGEAKDIGYHQNCNKYEYYFSGDRQLFEVLYNLSPHEMNLTADSRSSRLGPCLCRTVIHGFALDSRQNEITCICGLQSYGELFQLAATQVEVSQHAVVTNILVGILTGRRRFRSYQPVIVNFPT